MGFNIWKSETRSSLRSFLDTILKGIPYVITGGFAVQIYAYSYNDKSFNRRETKDIDIIVDKNSREELINILNNARIFYGVEKSSVKDCIRIYDGPNRWYSICFDELPDWEIVEVRNIKVRVESLESLLANKFATYLSRSEQKDLDDLNEIVKLLKKRGKINKEALTKAMKRYKIVDHTEKMFWLYLEYHGLISNAEEYVEFEDEEEKRELLYHLKSRFLISS